ncbi:hypothetical protein GGG16DRAFT_103492 [Schizophyllum commune]
MAVRFLTQRFVAVSAFAAVRLATDSGQLQTKYKDQKKKIYAQAKTISRIHIAVHNLQEQLREVREGAITQLQHELAEHKSRALAADACAMRLSSQLSSQYLYASDLRRELEGVRSCELVLNYELNKAEGECSGLLKEVRKLVKYQHDRIERGAQRAIKKGMTFRLVQKGIFSIEARALARLLALNGVPKRRVGRIIQKFTRKMVGSSGDHSADQQKVNTNLGEMHFEANLEQLGWDEMLAMAIRELTALYYQIAALSVEDAGGELAWVKLSPCEQAQKQEKVERALLMQLGSGIFETLLAKEQRKLRCFLWAGCCMHKDLNIVKHADCAMSALWEKHGIAGPVILPNKDNNTVLSARDDSAETPTELEERAMDASGRGGVKVTQLGGLICRHKDDKTGQQDRFCQFFSHHLYGQQYQSHTEAACFIIQHHDLLVAFLLSVRDSKTASARSWTNIEQNFYNALHNQPTISELVVLALWHVLVSCPWMRYVRQPEVNMLLLGPYHRALRAHLVCLRDDPARIFGPNTSFKTATADGKPYELPDVMSTILQLAPFLPYVEPLFREFMLMAILTFDRFTAELNPGGEIASLTAQEAQAYFINMMNDHNEGILGRLRGLMRSKPTISQCAINVWLMFKHNDTQAFMNDVFCGVDHEHVRRVNRKQDASGLEAKRREEEVEYREREAEENRQHDAERAAAETKKRDELQARELILDVPGIKNLRYKKEIEGQLDIHCLYDTDIPPKSTVQKFSPEDQHALLLRVVEECQVRARQGQANDLVKRVKGWKKRKDAAPGRYDDLLKGK